MTAETARQTDAGDQDDRILIGGLVAFAAHQAERCGDAALSRKLEDVFLDITQDLPPGPRKTLLLMSHEIALRDAAPERVLALGRIRTYPSEFRVKHEPGHPAADANGNVKYPNIYPLIELSDMREAQRSYEASINVIGATRRMIQRTLDILKV